MTKQRPTKALVERLVQALKRTSDELASVINSEFSTSRNSHPGDEDETVVAARALIKALDEK